MARAGSRAATTSSGSARPWPFRAPPRPAAANSPACVQAVSATHELQFRGVGATACVARSPVHTTHFWPGPAGSAAATMLARSGPRRDPSSFDKATFPAVNKDPAATASPPPRGVSFDRLRLDRAPLGSSTPTTSLALNLGTSGHKPLPQGRRSRPRRRRPPELDAASAQVTRAAGHGGRGCDPGAALNRTPRAWPWRSTGSARRGPAGHRRRRHVGLPAQGTRPRRPHLPSGNALPRSDDAEAARLWFEPDGAEGCLVVPPSAAVWPTSGSASSGHQPTRWPTWCPLCSSRAPHLCAFLGPDARAESPHRAWPIPAGSTRSC